MRREIGRKTNWSNEFSLRTIKFLFSPSKIRWKIIKKFCRRATTFYWYEKLVEIIFADIDRSRKPGQTVRAVYDSVCRVFARIQFHETKHCAKSCDASMTSQVYRPWLFVQSFSSVHGVGSFSLGLTWEQKFISTRMSFSRNFLWKNVSLERWKTFVLVSVYLRVNLSKESWRHRFRRRSTKKTIRLEIPVKSVCDCLFEQFSLFCKKFSSTNNARVVSFVWTERSRVTAKRSGVYTHSTTCWSAVRRTKRSK